MLATLAVVAALVFSTVYLALHLRLHLTQDSREPRMIETAIPYFTPVFGLRDNKYFVKLRERYGNLPISTLRLVAGHKIYLINDPCLIAAVQRQTKILTFQTISDNFSRLVCNISPAAIAIQNRETDFWLHGPTNATSPSASTFKALSPGKHLDEMCRGMLRVLVSYNAIWEIREKQGISFSLFAWIKEVTAIAATKGVYGWSNPYSYAEMRKQFWNYEAGLGSMSLGPIGRFFAKDSIKSQEFLTAKFEEYYRIGIFLDPSDLTRQRFDWHMSRGFSERDLAKLEVGHGIAILSNTAPAAFWFTLHIFSDPKVLQACREEVLQHVVDSKGSTGNPVRSFDIMALRTSCPILQSAFKEAMRLHSVSVGLRMVLQDHLLDGKYLLKKDAIVFMPSTVQHFDYERWGADAAEYKHDRFVDRTRPRVNNISFRAFGGGTTLCPGRHFAMTEILTLASMLLLRFELKPESGTWVIPTTKKAGLASIMPSPDFDVDVKMTRRADDEGVEWVWKLSDSEHKVCPEEKEMDEKSSEEKL